MSKIILIYGLSGSGKSTLANKLSELTTIPVLNADNVRAEANDWDFSIEGRLRQANRMKSLASSYDTVIVDMICPTQELRDIIDPHLSILINTLEYSKYEDTDSIFTKGKPNIIINSYGYNTKEIASYFAFPKDTIGWTIKI